jgi:small neutral amino acid transporter SnatA (MarC family)
VYKNLSIGTVLMILAVSSTIIMRTFHISVAIYSITGGIGCLCWSLAAIIMGILGRGDKIRADYYRDSDEEYSRRQQISWMLFLVGLPNIIAAVVIYLLFKPH